jgi:hypothetical protein
MTVTGEQDDKRNLKNTPSFALDTPSSLARSPPAQRLSARADVLDACPCSSSLPRRCLADAHPPQPAVAGMPPRAQSAAANIWEWEFECSTKATPNVPDGDA